MYELFTRRLEGFHTKYRYSGSERIKKLKAEGKTYEEILAAKPLYDLIEEPIMSDVPFIYCVYYGPLF